MGTDLSYAVPNSTLTLKWREPRVSQAVNRLARGIAGRGVVRGFTPVPGPGDRELQMVVDGSSQDSCIVSAAVGASDDTPVTYREFTAVTLDLSSFAASTELYIAFRVEYIVSNTTVANWRAYTVAEFNAGDPETEEAVVVCKVTLPGTVPNPIADADIEYLSVVSLQTEGSLGRNVGGQLVYAGDRVYNSEPDVQMLLGGAIADTSGDLTISLTDDSGPWGGAVAEIAYTGGAVATQSFRIAPRIRVQQGDRVRVEIWGREAGGGQIAQVQAQLLVLDAGGSTLSTPGVTFSTTSSYARYVAEFYVDDATANTITPTLFIGWVFGDEFFLARARVSVLQRNPGVSGDTSLDTRHRVSADRAVMEMLRLVNPNQGARGSTFEQQIGDDLELLPPYSAGAESSAVFQVGDRSDIDAASSLSRGMDLLVSGQITAAQTVSLAVEALTGPLRGSLHVDGRTSGDDIISVLTLYGDDTPDTQISGVFYDRDTDTTYITRNAAWGEVGGAWQRINTSKACWALAFEESNWRLYYIPAPGTNAWASWSAPGDSVRVNVAFNGTGLQIACDEVIADTSILAPTFEASSAFQSGSYQPDGAGPFNVEVFGGGTEEAIRSLNTPYAYGNLSHDGSVWTDASMFNCTITSQAAGNVVVTLTNGGNPDVFVVVGTIKDASSLNTVRAITGEDDGGSAIRLYYPTSGYTPAINDRLSFVVYGTYF